MSQIGGTLSWLGSGASYFVSSAAPTEEEKYETANEVSEDDFQDALDEELPDDGQGNEGTAAADEIKKMSAQIFEEFNKEKNLLSHFRRNKKKGNREAVPLFRGKFFLRQSRVVLIDDSKLKDLSRPFIEQLFFGKSDHAQEFSEIILFGEGFEIDYNHFDAMDLSNPHQVKILCSCFDMGVKVVKNSIQSKGQGDRQQKIETEVNEFIYRTRDSEHPSKAVSFDSETSKDLMQIEVYFGN